MKLKEIFANAPAVIDQAQREHYYDRGYLVFPSLIDAETLVPLRAAAAATMIAVGAVGDCEGAVVGASDVARNTSTASTTVCSNQACPASRVSNLWPGMCARSTEILISMRMGPRPPPSSLVKNSIMASS